MMEKELELEQDPPREVRVSGVELRVVDDTLDVKRDPEKELELRSEALQMHCCVQFYRGELYNHCNRLYPITSPHINIFFLYTRVLRTK